jgi:hypothetical protein
MARIEKMMPTKHQTKDAKPRDTNFHEFTPIDSESFRELIQRWTQALCNSCLHPFYPFNPWFNSSSLPCPQQLRVAMRARPSARIVRAAQ